MNFIVKICGITNADDARVAAQCGATAIGLNFYPKSPRAVSFAAARQIGAAVPARVLKVGVFVEPSEEDLQRAIEEARLDVVQLHGKCVPEIAFRTWRALAATDPNPTDWNAAEAILLDSFTPKYGGSGKVFDWRLAARFRQPVILAGGLDAANVNEAIGIAHPSGVDACSRLESAPGVKDERRVRAFVDAAFAAAESLERILF